MVFFKSALLVVGAYALYSYFRGDGTKNDRPTSSPPPPPPSYPRSRPRSPSPRRDSRGPAQPPPSYLYSSPTPARQRVHHAQSSAIKRQQRQPVENVSGQQPLSFQNLVQHRSRVEPSSSTELYRSQDHQCPKIEPIRNAGASNEDDERDPHYLHLRSEARKYYGLMAKSFNESDQARNQGDRARAIELSKKGVEYKGLMEKFDEQASEWIFNQNNKDNGPCNVDLHGLFVKEAITRTKQILNQAQARNDRSIRFIVGKGLHAKDGNAKLKPAIENLIQESGLSSIIDPSNSGVLIVDLDPAHAGSSGDAYFFRDRTNLLS